jgi:hypothetical protein
MNKNKTLFFIQLKFKLSKVSYIYPKSCPILIWAAGM